MAIFFPVIDPVAFEIGPLVVRWYALAYLAGFILGWRYCMSLADRLGGGRRPDRNDVDDFLIWAIIGVILGGRIGYVLFYQFDHYMEDPLGIFRLWEGGMSFHGGLIGVVLAVIGFSNVKNIPVLTLSDIVCAGAPIGLFFGRIANFVNAELYGRITSLPFGVVFPNEPDGRARHPSQLYEAFLEGAVLFFLFFILVRRTRILEHPGMLAGLFFLFYGLFRFVVEFVREPDAQLGLLGGMITMGQVLCLPMILFGAFLFLFSRKNSVARDATHAS